MKKVFLPLFLLPGVLVGCGNEDNRPTFEYTFEDQTVTYDGEDHSILIEGFIPEGFEVTYSNNGQVNAGEYQIGVKIEDPTGSYKGVPKEEIFATLKIEKAELNKEEFFPSQQVTYDSNKHSLAIVEDKLPAGLSAEIVEPTEYIACGTYDYTAVVTDSNEHKNYVIEESYTSTLTIGKIALNEEDFLFESVSAPFDGETHSVKVKNKDGTSLPIFYFPTYDNNNQVEEGEYTVTVHLGNNEDVFTNKITLTTTLTITEQVMPTKVGDKYFFGRYPQTIIHDSAVFNALEQMTETNERGYFVYNGREYAKINAKHYSDTSTPRMEGYGEYMIGQTMYFEVKPICWIVCEINNGQYLLRSQHALDNVNYYDSGIRSGKYESDYSYSVIRAFLNGLDGTSYSVSDYSKKNTGFYSRAFTSEEQNKMVTMSITNGSGASYTGKTTNDKVTIVSQSDLKNAETAYKYRYITSTTTNDYTIYDPNAVEGTQYVIARGALYRVEQGQYSLQVRTMTRTPYGDSGHYCLPAPQRYFRYGPLYYTKTANTYDACIPIITVTL